MYDRAPRQTANFNVGSTKDNVGPGSYDVPLPRFVVLFLFPVALLSAYCYWQLWTVWIF